MAVPGLHRHPNQGIVHTVIERVDSLTVKKYSDVYSAFVVDHFGKHPAMEVGIKPVAPGMKICGPAVTALGADLSVRRMAIDLMEPGDVLIVAAGNPSNRSCFGDGTALRMSTKSLGGAVIDGLTRDVDGIAELGFPTFCRGATQRNYHYPSDGEHGAVNVPVVCGGVLVNPGDLVIGDGDGVVAIERHLAEEAVDTIVANLDAEREMRAQMTSYEPFGVEQELRSRGYRFASD